MVSSTPEISSDEVVRTVLAELTLERVRELAENLGVEADSDEERLAALADHPEFDHEAMLEFCSTYEMKDVCRAFDLPVEGADADTLRRRVRAHLYLPPAAVIEDGPEELCEETKRKRREEARKDREFRSLHRRIVSRWGIGAGFALFLTAYFSPIQSLSGAIFLFPLGCVVGAWIAHHQFDHLAGAFIYGGTIAVATLVGMPLGLCDADFVLWLFAGAIGAVTAMGSKMATEAPRVRLDFEGPPERRPLIELIDLLPPPRLNSLALDIDRELPIDRSHEQLVMHIARHGTFNRDRVLRSMEERELRDVARRMELREAEADVTEDDLRHAIGLRFDLDLASR